MTGSRPVEITVPEIRDVAARLLGQVSTLADAMLKDLVEHIPEAGADPEIKGLTLGSCSSNLETALSMVRHGIPASATEAPVMALEHARAMAARGHSVDLMLRFYRLGHAYFLERLHEGVGEWIVDERAALHAISELERFSFAYIDWISSQVAAEYVAELERRQNRARAVRMDAVRALLAGDSVDLGGAERALAYRLGAAHTAFVCWSEDGEIDLMPVGAAVARDLGSQHPLLVADGATALWGWVASTGAEHPEAGHVEASLAEPRESVHVALGEPQHGVTGFRESHLEALRARRVIELSGRSAPSVTRFGQVAVVDALSQDLDAARSLVVRELGLLAAQGQREDEERTALLAVLDAKGSLAAAASRLGLHRNTVLQRVHRAEERRGRPASDALLELHAALRLADVLGATVLTGAQR